MTLFEEIRLNNIRLDSCEFHEFDVEHLTAEDIQRNRCSKVECRNCKGKMRVLEANQYIRGVQAAGGNPVKVWANWCEPGEEIETACPQCLGHKLRKPNCGLCEGLGYVSVSVARTYLKDKDNE